MQIISLTIIGFVILSLSQISSAQDSIPMQVIEEILLTDISVKKGLPWTYHKDTAQLIDVFQPSLRQLFDRQVGVQSFNGENFAQDIRISIRGYGGRAAFGIRGIRLYQDGIPLTSPDGTTQLDELSGFDIHAMDIVRSGMAARLGNSAGGTIALKSTDYFNGIKLSGNLQQFGAYSTGIKYGKQTSAFSNVLSVNHHYFAGKRDYSRSRNTTIYNKLRFKLNEKWQLEWLTGLYWSPIGTDPGGRTLSEIATDKFGANPRNEEYKAGEKVNGLMTALTSKYFVCDRSFFQSSLFYRKRNFEALLPFESGGLVNLDRDFVGISNSYEIGILKSMTISVGHTAEYQNDHRKLFKNLKGIKGDATSNQNETVFNTALFQQLQISLKKWEIHQQLRWDYNRYQLKDQFPSDGIQDGHQNFNNINGSFGVGFLPNKSIRIFSNISTSFEMPSLNELSNNPNGPGFNPLLSPEKSVQLETGFSIFPARNLKVQGTLFFIRVQDQIVSYELPATPGRSYYRNAAISNRRGAEVSVQYRHEQHFNINFNYVWSDYRYLDFVSGNFDYSGNFQTLIPKHKLQLTLSLNIIKYVGLQLSCGFNDGMWLDDGNTIQSKSYGDLNMLIHTTPSFSQKVQVGLQLNNAFNLMSYSNFRSNAAAMRFYEIASPMHAGIFFKVDLAN